METFVCEQQGMRLLEMFYLHHVEMKNVFTFQPIKRLVSTSVKGTKPAATFRRFLQRPKTDNCAVWWQWQTLFCQKDESWLRKWKTISFFFKKSSPPIRISHTRTWAKESKNLSFFGIIVSISHWLIQLTWNFFPASFYTLSVYTKATWFFSISNDGVEWSFDFGRDSVTLIVADLVQKVTISSQETPLAAWSLLLS